MTSEQTSYNSIISSLQTMKYLFAFVLVTLMMSQSNAHLLRNDNMCNATREVLCVTDVLLFISNTTIPIQRLANRTQKQILHRNQKQIDTFNRYVDFQINYVSSQLPDNKNHAKFPKSNNINKVSLEVSSIFVLNSIILFLDRFY